MTALSPALPRWEDVPGLRPRRPQRRPPRAGRRRPPGGARLGPALGPTGPAARPTAVAVRAVRGRHRRRRPRSHGRGVAVPPRAHRRPGRGPPRRALLPVGAGRGAPGACPRPWSAYTSGAWDRWRSGWAEEGEQGRGRWPATPAPRCAGPRRTRGRAPRRARELAPGPTADAGRAGPRAAQPAPAPHRRTATASTCSHVDLDVVRAGARLLGGSANDGFMAAMSIGLRRYHLDHGVKVPEVRSAHGDQHADRRRGPRRQRAHRRVPRPARWSRTRRPP